MQRYTHQGKNSTSVSKEGRVYIERMEQERERRMAAPASENGDAEENSNL
jgi:hypothetical protein